MPSPVPVLFGLRGSGKSTLSRLLAVRLDATCIDLDDRVRGALDAPDIATAFRQAGERVFRAAEYQALKDLLNDVLPGDPAHPLVLALGGGTPTHEPSRQLLQEAAERGQIRLLLLEAAPAVLGARVAALPGDRPLLAGTNFAEEAALLSERRLPIYRALAHAVIRSDQPTADVLEELYRAATS